MISLHERGLSTRPGPELFISLKSLLSLLRLFVTVRVLDRALRWRTFEIVTISRLSCHFFKQRSLVKYKRTTSRTGLRVLSLLRSLQTQRFVFILSEDE